MSTGIVVFYDSVRGFGFVKPFERRRERRFRASVGAGAGRNCGARKESGDSIRSRAQSSNWQVARREAAPIMNNKNTQRRYLSRQKAAQCRAQHSRPLQTAPVAQAHPRVDWRPAPSRRASSIFIDGPIDWFDLPPLKRKASND